MISLISLRSDSSAMDGYYVLDLIVDHVALDLRKLSTPTTEAKRRRLAGDLHVRTFDGVTHWPIGSMRNVNHFTDLASPDFERRKRLLQRDCKSGGLILQWLTQARLRFPRVPFLALI